MRHGNVVWFKGQGMMDREAGKAMPTDALFRICSMTKPITSVAVMNAVRGREISARRSGLEVLAEFKNPKVLVKPVTGEPSMIPATREITIRDLLRHTSGLTYNWNETLGTMYTNAKVTHGLLPYDGTNADNVKRLAALPLLFNPGERWEYSMGVDVLGRLVEVVSASHSTNFFAPASLNRWG